MTETRILRITTKGAKESNKQLWEMLESIVGIEIEYIDIYDLRNLTILAIAKRWGKVAGEYTRTTDKRYGKMLKK